MKKYSKREIDKALKLFNEGKIEQENSNFQDAEKKYKESLGHAISYQALNNLMNTYFSLDDFDKTQETFELLVKHKMADVTSYFNMGQTMVKQKRYLDAITYFIYPFRENNDFDFTKKINLNRHLINSIIQCLFHVYNDEAENKELNKVIVALIKANYSSSNFSKILTFYGFMIFN